MAIKDANIALTVHGDSSNLRRDLKKANKSLDTLETKAKRVAANVAKLGAASTVAGAAIATALFNDQRKVIDSLAKTADALSITTENLQALQHLASLAGVESKALNNSLQKMQKNLGEAARKGGVAADALGDVGLNIKDILKLSPDKQLIALSKAFDSVKNTTVKASIASDIFGRNGLKMLKVMNQLKDEGLEPTVQALEDMGASLNRLDAGKVEDANDAIDKAKVSATALAQAMTIAVAPAVKAVADKFTDWVKSTGGIVKKIQDLQPVLEKIVTVGKAMAVIFGARLVAAFSRYAIAQTLMVRNTMKQITWLKALDFASKGLSRSLALLGGPLGIITIAATALAFWATSTNDAEQPTKDLTSLVDSLGESYGEMTIRAKEAALVELEIGLEAKEKQLAAQREIIAGYDKQEDVLWDIERALQAVVTREGESVFLTKSLNDNLAHQANFNETLGRQRILALEKEEALVAEIQKAVDLKRELSEASIVPEEVGGEFTSNADLEANQEKLDAQQAYFEDRYLSQLKAGEDLSALALTQRQEEMGAMMAHQFQKIQALKASEVKQTGIKADAMEAQKAIDTQKGKDSLQIANSMFSGLSSLMSSENEKLFKVGKAAAIAGAVVDGITSAISSYKFGASMGGPILGAAAAAASLVSTGAMISNLKSQSFSGGGSTGGAVGGSGGFSQATQQQSQSSTVNRTLTIDGIQDLDSSAFTSGGTLTALFDIIREAQRNGEQVII